MRDRNAPEDSVFSRCVFVRGQVHWYRGLLDAPFHRRRQDERSIQRGQNLNVPMDISVRIIPMDTRKSENDMQWRDRSFTRLAANLQRAAALAQSKSTYSIVLQMQQSLMQLASIEQLLKLHIQWDSGQARRQQQRLMRQRARLQRQQAMLEQLRDER